MPVKKYRKKPVVIKAIQWTGKNENEIDEFVKHELSWGDNNDLFIETLEGTHLASKGDWIIQGVRGEFYPCKPDIFKQTYEEV